MHLLLFSRFLVCFFEQFVCLCTSCLEQLCNTFYNLLETNSPSLLVFFSTLRTLSQLVKFPHPPSISVFIFIRITLNLYIKLSTVCNIFIMLLSSSRTCHAFPFAVYVPQQHYTVKLSSCRLYISLFICLITIIMSSFLMFFF